jgi:hypothetical protein
MNRGTSLHTRKGQASRSAKHNERDGPPLSVIPVPNNKETSATAEPDSLQLRVLHLGFLQDGDVGVGVFPEGKEILIGGAALLFVALECIGPPQSELRQRHQWVGRSAIPQHAPACDGLQPFPETGGNHAAATIGLERLITQIFRRLEMLSC